MKAQSSSLTSTLDSFRLFALSDLFDLFDLFRSLTRFTFSNTCTRENHLRRGTATTTSISTPNRQFC
jgi:hypothetical protein